MKAVLTMLGLAGFLATTPNVKAAGTCDTFLSDLEAFVSCYSAADGTDLTQSQPNHLVANMIGLFRHNQIIAITLQKYDPVIFK